MNALKLISKCNLKDDDEVSGLLENVQKVLKNDEHFEYYWEDLIKNAHEFLIEDEE